MLRAGRAARLARGDAFDAEFPQPFGEQARLRGFAGALPAFERDETSATVAHFIDA